MKSVQDVEIRKDFKKIGFEDLECMTARELTKMFITVRGRELIFGEVKNGSVTQPIYYFAGESLSWKPHDRRSIGEIAAKEALNTVYEFIFKYFFHEDKKGTFNRWE